MSIAFCNENYDNEIVGSVVVGGKGDEQFSNWVTGV